MSLCVCVYMVADFFLFYSSRTQQNGSFFIYLHKIDRITCLQLYILCRAFYNIYQRSFNLLFDKKRKIRCYATAKWKKTMNVSHRIRWIHCICYRHSEQSMHLCVRIFNAPYSFRLILSPIFACHRYKELVKSLWE